MLTVMLECENSEPELAYTLSVLVSGAVDGVVSEVIVLDRGSQDGTARLADAAGCKYLQSWTLSDTVRRARGEWLLFLEPGARPQNGWVEEVLEYAAIGGKAARFSASRRHRQPWFRRLAQPGKPFEYGLLVQKRDLLAALDAGVDLARFARNAPRLRLRTELIPAAVQKGRAKAER
ncbi:glycosyl transferase [Rhizobium sp. G21]|uniref:glycosyl transferase n=1 Tax=Rhizobium sp. G21 TaxID=2758439 RepID=UPI0015FF91F6|nr:glycosyl transferase [Rhizobium sp. G21]MBB1248697.1 glycosyl transferase [Rhizobium sp. G21]